MKYILRTIWLIGYVCSIIFTSICFIIALLTYPLVASFYFIKTGNEDIRYTPDTIPAYIYNKYRKLLKYL